MTCDQLREELGGYVLGALEPAERDAVATHLARCPECAAEHARLAGLPALLRPAEGLEIPAPPAAVEERLLDRLAHERGLKTGHGGGSTIGRLARRRGGRTGRFRPAALSRGRGAVAAALAGAALGAGVTALALGDGEPEAPPPQYAMQLTGATGATAHAELQPGRGGTELHLWVKGLPPGAETVYEVRCERTGWSATAGTFRADARGRAYVVLTTAARMGEYERIRIVRHTAAHDTDVMSGEIQ